MNQTSKKPTKKQIEAQINSAIVMIKKGKNYRMHRFGAMGVTIHYNDQFAILERVHTRTIFAIPSHGYYQLSNLVEIANKPKEEVTDNEKYLMKIIFDWIYLIADADFVIQSEVFVQLSSQMYEAKNTLLFDGKEHTRMSFINDFVKMFRLGSIRYTGEISDDTQKIIAEQLDAIEKEAADKIKKLFIDNNVDIVDTVLIAKDDTTEHDAMQEVITDMQMREQFSNDTRI